MGSAAANYFLGAFCEFSRAPFLLTRRDFDSSRSLARALLYLVSPGRSGRISPASNENREYLSFGSVLSAQDAVPEDDT